MEGEDGENVEVWGQMAGNIKWEFEVLGTMTNAEWGRWSPQPYASRHLFETISILNNFQCARFSSPLSAFAYPSKDIITWKLGRCVHIICKEVCRLHYYRKRVHIGPIVVVHSLCRSIRLHPEAF